MNFGRISRSSTETTKTIALGRGDAGPLSPKLLPFKETKGLEVNLREIEPGEKYSLEFTARPPFENNTLRAKVQLDTGVPEDPSLIIPIYGSIAPRVTARPSRIVVPEKPRSGWKQSVRLAWDTPEAHKIISATVSDPTIVARVGETGGAQEVVLALASAQAPASGSYMLTIVTDDAEMPQLSVPINVGRPAPPRRKQSTAKGPPRAGNGKTPTKQEAKAMQAAEAAKRAKANRRANGSKPTAKPSIGAKPN